MRALREDERDEIEAVGHLLKYVNSKPNIQSFKVWDAVMQLNEIGCKYVLTNIVEEKELNELIGLDDMKETVSKLKERIMNYVETGDTA